MKFKYLLKRTINVKTGYLIGIVIIAILTMVGYFSYAIFTVSNESKGSLNIVTGNLYPYIESADLNSNKSIVVNPNDSTIITVKLINVNGIDVKTNIYYSATSQNIEVNYLEKSSTIPNKIGFILGASGTETDSATIDIKITNNDSTSPVTVTFGSNVGLSQAELKFPIDKHEISKFSGNPYIIKAYNYNDALNSNNYCLTGKEKTCEVTQCYKSKTAKSCPAGTIFRYKVKDDIEKTFYVIEDKGDVVTLQQRENTVTNVAWYENAIDNSKGPETILASLEEATKNWDNVLEQKYTMGTTTFGDSNFTSCSSYNSCSSNAYTLTEKVARARMITAQEAANLSCTDEKNSCPKWMHNYLYLSKNYGGSEEDNLLVENKYNIGYWTMSAYTTVAGSAMHITNSGSLTGIGGLTTNLLGARAVIEISK